MSIDERSDEDFEEELDAKIEEIQRGSDDRKDVDDDDEDIDAAIEAILEKYRQGAGHCHLCGQPEGKPYRLSPTDESEDVETEVTQDSDGKPPILAKLEICEICGKWTCQACCEYRVVEEDEYKDADDEDEVVEVVEGFVCYAHCEDPLLWGLSY